MAREIAEFERSRSKPVWKSLSWFARGQATKITAERRDMNKRSGEGGEEKNVNRFPKQQQRVLVFADSFAGALLIRMRAALRANIKGKSRHNQFSYYFFCVKCVIIIFILLFHSGFSLHHLAAAADVVVMMWKNYWEEERARYVNFLPFEVRFLFFVISILCECEREGARLCRIGLNDH